MTRALVIDVCVFARFKVNCESIPLRSLANLKLVMSVHRKELRGAPKHGALGHGLFGLCVSPSLVRIRLRRLVGIRLVKVYF